MGKRKLMKLRTWRIELRELTKPNRIIHLISNQQSLALQDCAIYLNIGYALMAD